MIKVFALMITLCCLTKTDLHAQVILRNYNTLTVPQGYNVVYVKLQGADGGTRHDSKGGQGATIEGYIKVGSGTHQINPGASLRIIPGERGQFGSGGGGTALAYQQLGSTKWTILAVAGGGGGASSGVYEGDQTDVYVNEADGSPATIDHKATGAGKSSANGYGGGGAFSGGSNECAGNAGMLNGIPRLANGGSGCFKKGGAGFGSGGASVEVRQSSSTDYYYGGGGGGYSGGDGGKTKNGGGSYYDRDYFINLSPKANGTTDEPQDGFIAMKFINSSKMTLASAPTPKCMTNKDENLQNSNNIYLFDCKTDVKSQDWNLENGQVHLSFNDKKCLDIKDGKTAKGTNVQLWDCLNPDLLRPLDYLRQQWIYDGRTKQLRSFLDLDKCLNDAYGGKTDNGTNIMLWDCNANGGKADQWDFDNTETVSSPTKVKYMVPFNAPGFAIHSHTYKEVGSNIQLWTKVAGNAAETWFFDGVKLKMKSHPDRCIDIKNNSTSNGANVHLWSCNDKRSQQWVYDGMTKSIRSGADPNKCMQVKDGNYAKRANIELWTCNGSAEQQFSLME